MSRRLRPVLVPARRSRRETFLRVVDSNPTSTALYAVLRRPSRRQSLRPCDLAGDDWKSKGASEGWS